MLDICHNNLNLLEQYIHRKVLVAVEMNFRFFCTHFPNVHGVVKHPLNVDVHRVSSGVALYILKLNIGSLNLSGCDLWVPAQLWFHSVSKTAGHGSGIALSSTINDITGRCIDPFSCKSILFHIFCFVLFFQIGIKLLHLKHCVFFHDPHQTLSAYFFRPNFKNCAQRQITSSSLFRAALIVVWSRLQKLVRISVGDGIICTVINRSCL